MEDECEECLGFGPQNESTADIDQLRLAIRRELLAIVEHPLTSEALKNNPLVMEWLK